MRKSIIYVFVALTLMSLGLALVPTVFSQTQSIKIVSYSYYFDSAGYLDVVGEAQNVGPNTVTSPVLTGTVYASDGSDQAYSFTTAWVTYLAPQQKAPFYMEFSPYNLPSGTWQPVANIALNVVEAKATSSYQYPDLTITSSPGTVGTSGNFSGAYLVKGVVQNTGNQAASNLTVVAAFFNSTGAVVAVGHTDLLTPRVLEPSQTASFQVAAWDLNQSVVPASMKISRYELLVQAQGPILQGTAPIVTPYPSSSSSSSTSTTSSPSPTTNNSNNVFNPTIIVAMVVIVILAIAGTLVALRKSKPHMTIKEAKKARKKSMG